MTEEKRESLTRIVHDFDTGQSWNELEQLPDGTYEDEAAWARPTAAQALYACGEELAEERRAHRETRRRLAEAEGRPSYFGLGFVVGLAFAFFMSAVVTLL